MLAQASTVIHLFESEVEGPGFNQPGPLLEEVRAEEEEPVVLHALSPIDDSSSEHVEGAKDVMKIDETLHSEHLLFRNMIYYNLLYNY